MLLVTPHLNLEMDAMPISNRAAELMDNVVHLNSLGNRRLVQTIIGSDVYYISGVL